ncbi:peptidase U32 family [methanogenic archaeon mixed culture ISO4-G1]|nr:peptidase U32 family [methanogenic archaeon mixed culture ISO4-G1]
MEILSPVGSPDSLVAAIKGGCDAVYLAGKSFGARAFAGNFSDGELEGAIAYAHDHGVKVHVTVNTLIKDSEMEEAVSFVKFLKDIDADAIIIQDLGLLKNLTSVDIHKHASTQMQIHSLEGIEWCAEHGLDRVVLAREITLDELKQIVPESPIETEVFIQGAMCYCMSGGCLLSSFIGGRSGNRGSCAQPCRKLYTRDGEQGYFMSCADIYGMKYLKDLSDLGVTSLKIEGRMRSPPYTYLASKAYSMAMKGETGKEFDETLELLRTVFNRGTCDGYLGGVVSPVQSLYPDNRGFFIAEVRIKDNAIVSEFDEPVGIKDGLSIFKEDEKIGGFKVMDLNPIHIPFKIPDGKYQIYRTYDPRIDVIKNDIGSTPRFRGETVRSPVTIRSERLPPKNLAPELSFYVNTIKGLEAALPYATRIYFDNMDKLQEAKEAADGVELVALLPRFDALDEFRIDDMPVMVNNPGQYRACRNAPRIYGSNLLNMFNSFFPMNLYQTTLSVELSRNEVSSLMSRYPGRTEVMAFGRTELMYTRDPAAQNGSLTDETGASFPVYKDGRGFAHILNSVDLDLTDLIPELGRSGVSSVGLDLRKRPSALVKTVGEVCINPDSKLRARLKEMCGGTTTRGLYARKV